MRTLYLREFFANTFPLVKIDCNITYSHLFDVLKSDWPAAVVADATSHQCTCPSTHSQVLRVGSDNVRLQFKVWMTEIPYSGGVLGGGNFRG